MATVIQLPVVACLNVLKVKLEHMLSTTVHLNYFPCSCQLHDDIASDNCIRIELVIPTLARSCIVPVLKITSTVYKNVIQVR